MKHFLLLLTVLFILLGTGYSRAGNVDVIAQTGFEYNWWRDSESNTGYQILIPVRVATQYKAFAVNVLGGYAYSDYDSNAYGLNTLSQLTDTKVNLSYALLDKLPFDVLFGLDFNIPTARTNLSNRKLSLLMDPDLVPLSQLGEGFNINPTLSVSKDWGRLITGLGIGYVWRGKYDYSTYFRDYEPGDIFTATAEARYDFTSLWSGRLFGQYARFGNDELRDRPIYREGDYYMTGLGLQYAPKPWNASLTFRYIYRGKSELRSSSYSLSPTSNSLWGNEYAGDLMVSYLVSEPTTIWIRISGLYVQKNDYPDTYYCYIGKRLKASLELGWKRAFGQHWETNLFLRGFTMHDDNRLFPDYMSERTYNGFSVGGAIIARY